MAGAGIFITMPTTIIAIVVRASNTEIRFNLVLRVISSFFKINDNHASVTIVTPYNPNLI